MNAESAPTAAAPRVAVFEADGQVAATLDERLRYLEAAPVVIDESSATDTITAENWDAVVLGQIDDSESLQDLFLDLSKTCSNIPVLDLGKGQRSQQLLVDCRPDHLWPLETPLRRADLSRLLERARRYSQLDRRRRLTGSSTSIREVRAAIEQVAERDTTVLITGESGTGKELVARTLHGLSDYADGPFVPINCGAIQPELLESELFGHDKGAFTGAVTARKGRLELAANGTLFLDEIGDMSLEMQVKLLRVLQEREFQTVGGGRRLAVQCRIVAATHRELPGRISDGLFREDLYYRLNVFPIHMPPLRKRIEDLPGLLDDLMLGPDPAANEHGLRLTARATEALAAYNWPGNIRELANLVERLAILIPSGLVDLEDLPEKFHGVTSDDADETSSRPSFAEFNDAPKTLGDGVDLKEVLVSVEVRMIRQALDQAAGNVAKAARLLQLQRTTLVEKCRKYRLNSDDSSDI
ncbi:MAG: sigma-54-dependent Fis family transcriptional regulator [Pseudomonadota bacterium]